MCGNIGGMNENKYIEELDKIISKDRYVNLVGLTDLRQMAIVISRSTVVVSGDSGPMHMAYSLGRFVIALGAYGSSTIWSLWK